MKLKVLFLALALALSLCLPVAAASVSGGGISLDMPDDYLIITPDTAKDNAEAAKVLGFTEKTLKTHMQDNGMLFLALTGNNTKQIQLRELLCSEDSFAAKIGDLSLLDNEDIRNSAAILLENANLEGSTKYQVVANSGGLKAIKITSSGDTFMSEQYITVRNGKIYSLVGFDAPGANTEYLADIFETLRIDKQRSGFTVAKGAQVVTTIIVVALVAVAIIVIVRLIASFVTDFKNRDNDVREFVKIKRRKF